MKVRSKQKQEGVSLTGLILILAVLGVLAVLAMQVVPSVTEYLAIKKAIVKAKTDGTTPAEIRSSFDKQAEVGYIDSINGKDLEIVPQDGALEVSFAYEKRIPLVGPASLVLNYQGTTAPNTAKKRKTID